MAGDHLSLITTRLMHAMLKCRKMNLDIFHIVNEVELLLTENNY